VLLSDVHAVGKRPLFAGREWNATDKAYAAFLGGMHVLACFAPFTFSWPMVGLFLATYFVSGCLGITLSYHRQLSHRSFATPKWLEYVLAYCGVLAVQGDPLEWASSHRYHHLHTDTPLDPHSPYEGFWWSHMGWLLDNKVRPGCGWLGVWEQVAEWLRQASRHSRVAWLAPLHSRVPEPTCRLPGMPLVVGTSSQRMSCVAQASQPASTPPGGPPP
jgi:fatty-acid desaturase